MIDKTKILIKLLNRVVIVNGNKIIFSIKYLWLTKIILKNVLTEKIFYKNDKKIHTYCGVFFY